MQKKLVALLQLFRDYARDKKSNALVLELVFDKSQWPRAHDMFHVVRDRVLRATGDAGRPPVAKGQIDRVKVCQYYFEELCLKSVYNETNTQMPFDLDSPFWVTGTAIQFAREAGISIDAVIAIVASPR